MNLATLGNDLVSLATLTFLEIVLGIDNLVFVAIATSRLPAAKQPKARTYGLLLALVTRLLLLASASMIARFTNPLFSISSFYVSGRDLLLGIGGLFLIFKATHEIHAEFDTQEQLDAAQRASSKVVSVILQIAILDIIFSLDSVITAIGMTQQYGIMVIAIVIAILVMILTSHSLSEFIANNPSIKMLATSFILMVGTILVADGVHYHIPRGYLYFSISFSLFVETMNILLKRKKLSNK